MPRKPKSRFLQRYFKICCSPAEKQWGLYGKSYANVGPKISVLRSLESSTPTFGVKYILRQCVWPLDFAGACCTARPAGATVQQVATVVSIGSGLLAATFV